MRNYLEQLSDKISQLPSKFLKSYGNASDYYESNNKELEHVFDQITNLVQSNQSSIEVTLDKFSHSTAHAMVNLVEKHSMFIEYLALVVVATTLVVLGSFASVTSIPYTALPPTKLHPLFDPSDLDLDQDCHIVYADDDKKSKKKKLSDSLDEKHAILLPLGSGVTLLTLYFVITKLHIQWKTYLLKLLNFNIIVMSIPSGVFVYNYFASAIARYISHWGSWNPLSFSPRYRITISDDNEEVTRAGWFIYNFQYRDALTNELGYQSLIDKVKEDSWERQLYSREFKKPKTVESKRQFANMYINHGMLLSFLLSLGSTACYYFVPNDWVVCNIISMNFAIWSISQMKLKNLKSGVLILTALFFYDIYFVFGTKVMVTVASNLDLPIKLTLPTRYNTDSSKFEFSMLGLGDIALPGMFIALCYKYDIWKYHSDNTDMEFHLLNWCYVGKYFITAITSYILALATCMVALANFKVAQPALLYIVPYLLISTLFVAWRSGDLGQFWNFQYDTISLGENKLDAEKDKNAMTYSDYFLSESLNDDDDDNEEAYTDHDALIDYESDDMSDEEEDDDEDFNQKTAPEYKPTDILSLLAEATKGSEDEDADYVLDLCEDQDSETNTYILDDN